jgi:hypothetical protein
VGLGTATVDAALGITPPEASCLAWAVSLARTCSGSVACSYFVPLAVTVKDAELFPAAGPGTDPAPDDTAEEPDSGPAAALDAAGAPTGGALE